MAYVKTNWQTGDVITAAKLNNMETGIYDATEAAADAFAPDIDDPQDGDVIKYDSTEGKWVNGAGPAGDFDPDIDDPQDGDVIKYDGTAEKWVNAAGGSAEDNEFVITCTVTSQDLTGTIDKTQEEINAAYAANKNFKLSVPAIGVTALPLVFSVENDNVTVVGLFTYVDISSYLVRIYTNSNGTYGITMYTLTTNNP